MKPILYTLCLILALFSVCNVPAASYDTNSYPHLRDRNEKRIKEITKFIAAEAKKQQDAWFLAKQAQDQAKAGGNSFLQVSTERIIRPDSIRIVFSGEADAKDIEKQLRALMAEQPRGRQITAVYVVNHPLPRTATGKIKRWELQQETEAL